MEWQLDFKSVGRALLSEQVNAPISQKENEDRFNCVHRRRRDERTYWRVLAWERKLVLKILKWALALWPLIHKTSSIVATSCMHHADACRKQTQQFSRRRARFPINVTLHYMTDKRYVTLHDTMHRDDFCPMLRRKPFYAFTYSRSPRLE